MTDNDTFSFIQATTAVEALLENEKETEQIVQRLRDRTSFLLGKTIEQRKKIADEFEKIYKVRSKVIHGRKSQLTSEEKDLKFKLDNILKRLLEIEIWNNHSN